VLEKLKELFLKHTSELLGGLLTLLVGTLFWQIIPLLLSPLWTRLSPQTLQRILGLSLLSVAALLAYTLILNRRLRTKLHIKFGIYWDKHANPFCPACQTPLWGYASYQKTHGHALRCSKCSGFITIRGDDTNLVALADARAQVLNST
jgi:hypothetical protein